MNKKHNWKLTNDRILLKQLEPKQKGLLEVPESSLPKEYQVIITGPGLITTDGTKIPVQQIAAGDTVRLCGNGVDVELDGEKYKVVNYNDVLIVTESPKGNK